MKPISDEDLILLYYGEHEDPGLPQRVAQSDVLSRRFAAMSELLAAGEHYQAPDPGDDYEARLWQKLAPQLHTPSRAAAPKPALWEYLRIPRFSLAGAFSLLLVAGLAFWLGTRNGSVVTPAAPGAPLNIEANSLLQARLADHLDQADQLLTRLSNSPQQGGSEAEIAAEILFANRLYRRAAETGGHRRLVQLLNELETLLLQLANDDSAMADRWQQQGEDLLFKVRVIQHRLDQPSLDS